MYGNRTDKEAVTQGPKGAEVAEDEATSEEAPKEPNVAEAHAQQISTEICSTVKRV